MLKKEQFSFNRTIVELKFDKEFDWKDFWFTFNRTIVELKFFGTKDNI